MSELIFDSGHLSEFIRKTESNARVAERQRIASMLHDSIAQELSLIKSYVQTIEEFNKESKDICPLVNSLKEIVNESLEKVRGVSHDLYRQDVFIESFPGRLKLFVRRCNQTSGFNLILDFCDSSKWVEDVIRDEHLFSVIQEFVHNSIKHSEATCIRIIVSRIKNKYIICLSDNGVGFDLTQSTQSIGLKSIESRLSSIKGKYKIHSKHKQGTELIIELYA